MIDCLHIFLVFDSNFDSVGEFKKWGMILLKQSIFPFAVGNIDHLSCLKMWNIPSKVQFTNTVNFDSKTYYV